MNKVLFILGFFFLFFLTSNSFANQVKVYIDKDSAGWAYKTNDHAFVVKEDGCTIKWNAEEFKDGSRSLSVRKNCDKPFSEQIPMHKAILAKIHKKWPLSSFKSIYWGMMCSKSDWSWCIPIAKESLNSKDYIDYWKNYPNSKLKNINGLFVELANKTKSYKEFADLFPPYGVTVTLGSVEKVFEYRLKELPFNEQLKSLNIRGNPRAMFNVGMAYFRIEKLDFE